MASIELRVHKKNGLHVRLAAAFITTLQMLLPDKEQIKKTFVSYKGKTVQANNLLSLVSLQIGQGEPFTLTFEDDVDPSILHEIHTFFERTEQEDAKQAAADRLLMENSISLQEAIAGLPNGIIVVNKDNVITYVNKAAAMLLEKDPLELINHRADQVIPHSRLHKVMETGETEVAKRQVIKKRTLLTNRSPLFYDGQTIGAVSVFQDISDLEKAHQELKEVQELQQRLNLVLQSVSELIGLTDQQGEFLYTNEEMLKLLRKSDGRNSIQSIIGKKNWESFRTTPEPWMKAVKVSTDETYITKINPIMIDQEFRGAVVTMSPMDEIQTLLQKIDLMEQRTQYLELELSKHQQLDEAFQTIIGNSEALLDSLTLANKVSKTDATVMITGESGTGKELVARAIHEASERKERPFIRVNCAAIPPNLIESELFGHEKGAFTGAYKVHVGKFELAHQGTIFLDEIGDLNYDLQAKLLRVLQEKEVNRVGGVHPIALDVRVIAATNQDLKRMVEEGRFREDLYYRLNVIPIHLPPLRSRKDDVPVLVDHFCERFTQKLGKKINGYEPGVLERLCQYDWPGNIRELRNVMERMITLADDHLLRHKDLPSYIVKETEQHHSGEQFSIPFLFGDGKQPIPTLEEYEKHLFSYACQFYPSYNQLAQALGITHKTAAKKVRKYGLEHLLGKKYQNH